MYCVPVLVCAYFIHAPFAHARETEQQPEVAEPDENPLVKATGLYREATRRSQASDYNGAIKLWTEAYTVLPVTPENAPRRSRIIFSLAVEHVKAYNANKDLEHLRQSERLYNEYLEQLDPGDTATRSEIEDELERIQGIQQEAQAKAEEQRREQRLASVAAQEQAKADREKARAEQQKAEAEARELKQVTAARRGLLIAGITTTAGGLALLGVMGGGLYAGEQADSEGSTIKMKWESEMEPVLKAGFASQIQTTRVLGERANQLALGTGISGGVLVLTGAILTVVGAVRRGRVAPQPTIGRRGVGMSLKINF